MSKSSPEIQSSELSGAEPKTVLTSTEKSTSPLQPWEKPGFAGTTRRYLRSVQRYVWDDPDKPKAEKWFLFKLDVFLLSSACLGYFSRGLDASNINNAYVSGMKESLGMYGSELTYAQNVFTAGYVVGQLPAAILVTRVRPSILIPTLEVLWSICTFSAAAVTNVSHLYAIRFLVGLFESGYFPVMVYVIGSWYTKEERGKRFVLFYSSVSLAQMFSGYLQAGIYKNLDGVAGHSGWQWLFIMCGVISLPIAFLGYFFYPDFPETTKAFYITKEEAVWARERLILLGQKPLGAAKWDRTKIFRIASHWQFWLLPIGYFLIQTGFPIHQPAYAIWLKSTKHTVYQANVWPTGQTALGVVVQWIAGALSDSPLLRGRRWQTIIAMQSVTMISAVLLSVWNIPIGLKYVAFYASYFSAGVPAIYFAWFTDLMPGDHEMRGFVIAVTNTFSHIQSIWFILAVWRTVDAPRFKAGFTAAATFGSAAMVHMLIIRFLGKRDQKRRELEQAGIHDIESPVDSASQSNSAESEIHSESEKDIRNTAN